MAKLSDDEIKNIVSAELKNSIGYLDSEVAEDRRSALDYYLGEPFGDEIEGRSQVISRDVMDTVEWMLPTLLRTFAASDDVAQFEPHGPEDEAFCKQATDYANFIFQKDNPGFLILYTWIKDGLLSKVGVVKHYWEDTEEWTAPEVITGLQDDAFSLLVAEDEIDVLEHTEEVEEAGTVHSVKLRRKKESGRVHIENIPPEEFFVSMDARSDLTKARFVAHRRAITVSELIEMGFDRDLVGKLPTTHAGYMTEEADERIDDVTGEGSVVDGYDKSQREVILTEAYCRMDIDGDGIAELVKVFAGGDSEVTLLDWEEVDRIPFSAWSPILVPHRFHGLSIADLVMDVQRIKSTLMRQTLDNLYLANAPGQVVLEGAVNMDDALNRTVGRLVRVKDMGAIQPEVVPFVAGQTLPMLEFFDGIIDKRTGVSGATGLDPNVLQNATAAAVSASMSAAQQRVELIARIFGEVALKDLFRNILRIIVKHQQSERIIRLRNTWVPMDPRHWNADMDVSISVGLGNGNRDLHLLHLQSILNIQKEIMVAMGPSNPLVGLRELHHTITKMVENSGFKSADSFFKDPANAQQQPAQPPKPDPKMVEVQQKAQLDAAKMQMQAQSDQAKIASDIEAERARMAAEIGLKREQMAAEMQLKREQMAAEMALKREQMVLGMQQQAAMAVQPVRMGGDIG